MKQLIPGDAVDRSDDDPFAVYRGARTGPTQRPWVLANMVAGIDGSAAVGGRVGGLSSARDRELFVLLRSLADVVLIGAATVRAEGYGPVRLPPDLREQRVATGLPQVPPLAVVTRSLDLDWDSSLFATGASERPIVITAGGADVSQLAQAEEHAEVIIAGEQSVDLGLALADLHRRGMTTLLTEGGPTLLGELMAGGLLDELCLTMSPMAGGDPLPVAVRPHGPGELVAYRLASVLEEDGHLFLRYMAGSDQ